MGGVFFNADAKVTLLLKNAIGRARPSDLHGGFSFPSGHATTAYFVAGWLFFILLPMAAEALRPADRPADGGNRAEAGFQRHAAQLMWQSSRPGVAVGLVLLLAGTTQAGRLLADVHWASDLLAGALLGSSGVATSALILQALLRPGERGQSR